MSQNKDIASQIKHCFITNIVYLIIGLVFLALTIFNAIVNPNISWTILISMILAACFIVYSGLTIIKCIVHVELTRREEEQIIARLQNNN